MQLKTTNISDAKALAVFCASLQKHAQLIFTLYLHNWKIRGVSDQLRMRPL